MITGAHVLFYSKDPEADREFFRDVLGFPHVDLGHGWLIFKLPPAEAALHPQMDQNFAQRHAGHELLGAVLYLMCDDLPGSPRPTIPVLGNGPALDSFVPSQRLTSC